MCSNTGNHQGAVPTASEKWAAKGVVAISINYRLALAGIAHFPDLGITNLGLRDMIAALQWVKDNISRESEPNNAAPL